MQEFFVGAYTCQDEMGIPLTFRYFLLADECYYDNAACTDYGIMIRSSSSEEVRVPHISPNHNRITGLLSLLVSNGISPTHLHDVLDDWL